MAVKFSISEDWSMMVPGSIERELDWVEQVLGPRYENEFEEIQDQLISEAAKKIAEDVDRQILTEIFIDGNFVKAKYSTTKPVVNANVKIGYTES